MSYKKWFFFIFTILLVAVPAYAFTPSDLDVMRVRGVLTSVGVESEEEQDDILESLSDLPEASQERLAKKCLMSSDFLKCALEDHLIREDEQVKEFVAERRARGLETALSRVTNDMARRRLQENLVKIKEDKGFVYEEMTQGDGNTVIAKRKFKLLTIFPVTGIDTIEYTDGGEILFRKQNFWSRVFS